MTPKMVAPIPGNANLGGPTAQPVAAIWQRPPALAIVTQFYPPDFAATGQFVAELAAALAAQAMPLRVFTGQPGYVYAQTNAPREEIQNGVLVQARPVLGMSPNAFGASCSTA
ncbi:MAG: hypothetical protein ACUVSQ_00770 [Pseudanabaenaceae cyanobacterium]